MTQTGQDVEEVSQHVRRPYSKYFVMNYYDTIVKSYEELYGGEQLSKYAAAIKHRNLRKVLDIGCGIGLLYHYISEVLEVVPEIYVGVDISYESLKIFRSRHRGPGIVELVAADMDYPPFRPKAGFTNIYSFTTYICGYGDVARIMDLVDEEVLEECAITMICADRRPSCPEGFVEVAHVGRLEVLCVKRSAAGGI